MKAYINALTATRGIAALMVVVFHFGSEMFPFSEGEQFFSGGNLGVSYFFVLSGFVLYYTYYNRDVGFQAFMRRRIARIVPLYLFALMLSCAIPLYLLWRHGILLEGGFGKKLLLNVTFLQAYIPGYPLTINSPGWSLSVEMFFYLLFPFLAMFARYNKKAFVGFAILLYMASQAAHMWMIGNLQLANPTHAHDLIYYHPLGHINGFVAGMAGAAIFTSMHTRPKLSALIPGIATFALLTWRPISLHNGMLAPVFVLFIITVTANEPKWLTWAPLVFLGEISYGVYLLQEPIHKYMVLLNEGYFHLPYNEVFFYTYLGVLLIAAAITYYIIETPFRNLINGKQVNNE